MPAVTALVSAYATASAAPPLPAAGSLSSPDIAALCRALLDEIAADEDVQWGGGSISPSAYEAAWVALVRDPRNPGRLAFPEALGWLVRAQREDGGWGPPGLHAIVPSLAALLALRRAPSPDPAVCAALERGRRYLRRALPSWRAESVDTPFFEFLVPQLVEELARDGIALAVPDLELMRQRREAKLRRLPMDALYTGRSSLLHALEALGPDLDWGRLRALRAPNGGYGYSPSATAAVLLHASEWDEAAADWLRRLCAAGDGTSGPGAMPTSHPADTFEAAWALHLLYHGGVPLDPATSSTLRHILRWLHAGLGADGASFGRLRALPCDADDTALVVAALNRLGVQTAPDALWAFEGEDHFVSYDGERTASTSTNAHVLEALLTVDSVGLPHLAARRRKVVRYVLDQRAGDGSWSDKWHLSPYYATLSCALALARVPEPAVQGELRPSLAWLERTQRRGGGWGAGCSATLEETAYGVLTAAAIARALPEAASAGVEGMLARAERYLRRHLDELSVPGALLPALWVDKTLYAPARVIRAAVLAALYACSLQRGRTFERRPGASGARDRGHVRTDERPATARSVMAR